MKLIKVALSLVLMTGIFAPSCLALNPKWQAMNDSGEAFTKANNYSDAEKQFILARDYAAQASLKLELIKTCLDLGWLYDAEKRFVESEKMYSQALALRIEVLGANAADVGRTYRIIGTEQVRQNKFEEAEASFNAALKIFDGGAGGADPTGYLIGLLEDLSNVLKLEHKTAEAAVIDQRVLSMVRYH